MCGVIGLVLGDESNTSCLAAASVYESMNYLQHRGQDSCGIACSTRDGRIFQCKGNGLASKVFGDGRKVQDLPGCMGIGHLRYPTSGSKQAAEAQPFFTSSPYGISIAHNGNLVDAQELRRFLDQEAHRHVNTDSDSELMLNIFANELNETGKARVNAEDIFSALTRMYKRCHGGWACTAMIAGFAVFAFRDSHGIRPLVIGERPSSTAEGKIDYMIASESIALRQLGFKNIKDIMPGQAVLIQKGQSPIYHQVEEQKGYTPDIFEYVYFSRPDSVMDGIGINASRKAMGYKLADKLTEVLGPEGVKEIDVIVPIPDTAKTSAFSVAQRLNIPYCEAFVKNRYIFRTFIMPEQGLRQKSVRRKLSCIDEEFKGKCVLLCDDSVVRGTTSREIVAMAREAGARKVIFGICAPPITHPHIYGIDLASPRELIATNRNRKEIAAAIGADDAVFQDLDDLNDACRELSPPGGPQNFEVGVFCGSYVTTVPEGYFAHLAELHDDKKGVHNSSLVGSDGPTNVAPANGDSQRNGLEPEQKNERVAMEQEDINLHNVGNEE